MFQTTSTAIAAPAPLGTDASAGPLTLRVEEAIAAEGNAVVANTSEQNNPPPEDLAYVLARITVTNAGEQMRPIAATDFVSTGTDGVLRRCPSIAMPDPPLDALLAPGETFSGWTAGLVNDTSNVVLLFDPSIRAGSRFAATFALTDGGSLPTFDSSNEPSDVGSLLSAPASMGETVRTGLWEVTVQESIGVRTYYQISDYRVGALGEPGPNGWGSFGSAIGLEVSIRNITGAPQFFSWTALELIDTDGEPWNHLLAMTQPHPPASVELLPGATATGWYGIFTQPWATTLLLRLRDSVISDDIRYISLDGTSGNTSSTTQQASEPDTASNSLNLTPGDLAEVGADPLNLRDDASTSGEIVAELDPGTQLAITGDVTEAEGYRWYPVEVVETGEAGFVAEDFLVPSED